MKSKLLSRLLSVVLTLAICCIAVFGCFVSANAVSAVYSFGYGDTNDSFTVATIDLTFTSPAEFDGGIYGGAFKLYEVSTDVSCLEFNSITTDADDVETTEYTEELADGQLATVIFEAPNGVESVTFTLNLNITGVAAAYTLTLVAVEISNRYGNVINNITGENGVIESCTHENYIDGTSAEDVIAEGSCTEDRIVKTYCEVCGIQGENHIIPAAGHSIIAVDAQAPQTNVEGVKAHDKCENCGGLFVNGTPVNADDLVIAAYKWVQGSKGWWYDYGDGTYAIGWEKIGGVWYYFDQSGWMLTGWQQINSKWYYFNTSGAMVTGWQQINSKWYYFNTSGAMVTGWQQINSKWYYFNTSGAMVTGWQQIGSTWYYFKSGGAMVTGWQQISGTWYYFNTSGAMVTGWQQIGSTWYYFKSSGAMVTGTQTIGGKTYTFSSSGAWIG